MRQVTLRNSEMGFL